MTAARSPHGGQVGDRAAAALSPASPRPLETNKYHSLNSQHTRVYGLCTGLQAGCFSILFHLLSHQSEEAGSIVQDPSVGSGSVPSFLIPIPPLPSRTSESSKKVPNIADAHTTPWTCCASAISISAVVTTHLPSQDTAERNIPRDTLPLETWHVVTPPQFSGMSTSIHLYDGVLGAVPDSNPHLVLCGPLLKSGYFPPQLIWADW